MNEDPLPHLQDLLLRRDLTPEETRIAQEWLATHPEVAKTWDEHVRLGQALRRLPQTPVPSNFTARVLAEVRREASREERQHASPRPTSPASRFGLRFWFPTLATATCILAATAAWQWQSQRQLAEFRRDVTELRALASVPQDVLEDFEAIRRFSNTSPSVDFELLAALE